MQLRRDVCSSGWLAKGVPVSGKGKFLGQAINLLVTCFWGIFSVRKDTLLITFSLTHVLIAQHQWLLLTAQSAQYVSILITCIIPMFRCLDEESSTILHFRLLLGRSSALKQRSRCELCSSPRNSCRRPVMAWCLLVSPGGMDLTWWVLLGFIDGSFKHVRD